MSEAARRPDMTPERTPHPLLDGGARRNSFDEVELGYSAAGALQEAERCMDCPGRYCERACPLHVPIPDVLRLVRAGDFEGAYQLVRSRNPMPGVTGRVCPQERQCESDCTRTIKGEAVSIGAIERFLDDWHRENAPSTEKKPDANGKKVAVIGSGPAGLACAERLARAGCCVEVYEKQDRPGGAAGCEIPAFVLPRASMDAVLKELEELGVRIHLNAPVDCPSGLRDRYDAVFAATGAALPLELGPETGWPDGVVQAKDYLAADARPRGRRVLVIGGGATAVDAARTAVRDGAEQTAIVYRRTETEMPARARDLLLARDEGVQMYTLLSPLRFSGPEGTLRSAEFAKMELTPPDYPGGRNNVAATGETVRFEADLVILALGFRVEGPEGLPADGQGRILVAKDGVTTGLPGVFAGGDAVSGASTVARAAASGRAAAAAILDFLGIEPETSR